jgi:glycosyltransferase involved in cell wall biosynthesis
MQILFVINELSYFLAHRERLAKDALASGHEVTVASGSCHAADIKALDPNIKLIELDLDKHKFRPFADAKLIYTFIKIVRRLRPDIVHCFTIKPILMGGIATALAKLTGAPSRLVWTFAGLGKIYETTDSLGDKIRRWCVTSALRVVSYVSSAHATFENDEDRASMVARKVIPSNRSLTVMGTGIDLELFSMTDRVEQAEDVPVRILMATRLINAKGVNEYIEAARHFRPGGRAQFMLAGIADPTNPDAVEQGVITKAHSDGDIEFLGEVSQRDMTKLLPQTDVFCLPTQLKEGLPRSLLEAAACGVALIGSNQQTIATMVIPDKTGWLVDPFDLTSILDALDEAIHDPKKTARYGWAARQNLENLPVTAEAIWSQFERIYQAPNLT